MEEPIPWGEIQYYLKNGEEPLDEAFISWLDKKEENRQIWEETKLSYSITGNITPHFEPNQHEAWQNIERRTLLNTHKITLNQFFLRIAAAILLIFMGASATWMILHRNTPPVFTEIYSPYGHKTRITLPDSSQVWLNGNSHLRYETSFADSRSVELSGEALFKVTKDKNHVFTVKSDDLKVEVYGTKFNFKHYPEDKQAEVALLEGSVGLFDDNHFLTKMTPGQVAEYDVRENAIQVSRKNINPIISWSTDELIVDNEKFEEVLKYLERWYGVDITTSKDLKISQRLSFKVKTESLQELLSIINKISPIQYKIDGKEVIISKK